MTPNTDPSTPPASSASSAHPASLGGTAPDPGASPLLIMDGWQQGNLAGDSACPDEDETPADLNDAAGDISKSSGTDIIGARRLLTLARLAGWPVAHVLHRPPRKLFDPALATWHPVSGFAPQANEMIFVRQGASAFADRHFSTMALNHQHRTILVLSLAPAAERRDLVAHAQERGIAFSLVTADEELTDAHATGENASKMQEKSAPTDHGSKSTGSGAGHNRGDEVLEVNECLRTYAGGSLLGRIVKGME